MYVALDFFIGELKCRIISIDSNHRAEEDRRYYDHSHFCTELHWIEAGSCDYICDKTSYHIAPGQLIIIPPGTYHRVEGISKDFRRVSILVDISSAKETPNALEACFTQTFRPREVKVLSADSAVLTELRDRICRLLAHAETDSLSMERLRIACNSLLVELFDKISGDSLEKNKKSPQNDYSKDLVLDNHIAYQFIPGASFSALADQLHVSPRQLHRIITQKYGINYRDKIKEIRIEIATNFLCHTDKSVAQIAEIMGYSDTSSFSSFMKRATGSSPQQIRKAGKLE